MVEAADEDLSVELFDGPAKEVWVWLQEHYREYGETPGSDALTQRFPDFEVVESTESVPFYADKLREKFTYNRLRGMVASMADIFETGGSPFSATDLVRLALRDIEASAARTTKAVWSEGLQRRLEHYWHVKQHGFQGLKTPFDTLNDLILGFEPGVFCIIAADTGIGKTWMLIVLSTYHERELGAKVLFFTKEMTPDQIERRRDAYEFKLPYRALREGKLDSESELKWAQAIANYEPSNEYIVIDDEDGTPDHVISLIDQHKPDIVYIDGLYFMEGEGEAQWQRLLDVSRRLKVAAKRKGREIPIVVSSQLTDEGKLAYARGMKRDADLFLELKQNADQALAGTMDVEVGKQREGSKGTTTLLWDLDTMEFGDLPGANLVMAADEEAPADF